MSDFLSHRRNLYDSNKHQHRPSAAEVCFLFFPGCTRMLFVFQDEHRTAQQQTTADAVDRTWVTSRCVSEERWSQNQSEREESGSDSQLRSRKSLLQKLLTLKWLRRRRNVWTDRCTNRNGPFKYLINIMSKTHQKDPKTIIQGFYSVWSIIKKDSLFSFFYVKNLHKNL